jgi:hypothetical protein
MKVSFFELNLAKTLAVEIIHRLNFKKLDVISSSHHPVDILHFLETFKNNMMFLSRYDWSFFNLILSDEKEIKIVNDDVFVPVDFSIGELIESINKYRQEYKRKGLPHIEDEDVDDFKSSGKFKIDENERIIDEDIYEDYQNAEVDEDEYWDETDRTKMKFGEY